jgi:hypothetical protein
MPALGTWAETAIVNALLRNVSFTLPTTWFLALYLTNPTAANTGTEVSGVSYVRQPILFGPPSGGTIANSTDIAFPLAGTTWGNIAYGGILDASSGGHLLFYGSLVTPRYINAGDVLKFLTGSVVITVS